MKGYKPSHIQRKIAVKKKAIKRKKFLKSRIFFDIVLAVLFFGALIYFFFFSQIFKIKNIQIISFAKAPKEGILAVVEKEMQANVLFFIKKDSFFLVNSNDLETKIAREFPLISNVEVKKGLNRSLFIEAKPRIAQAIWCVSTPESCFVADQQRILFSQMNSEMSKDNLIFIKSENSTKEIFKEACSEVFMERVQETNKILNDFGLFNPTFVEKSNGFLYVKTIDPLNLAGGWEIFFNPKKELASDMLKLKILLGKEISQEKRKTLEYIDLRFSKAYYK